MIKKITTIIFSILFFISNIQICFAIPELPNIENLDIDEANELITEYNNQVDEYNKELENQWKDNIQLVKEHNLKEEEKVIQNQAEINAYDTIQQRIELDATKGNIYNRVTNGQDLPTSWDGYITSGAVATIKLQFAEEKSNNTYKIINIHAYLNENYDDGIYYGTNFSNNNFYINNSTLDNIVLAEWDLVEADYNDIVTTISESEAMGYKSAAFYRKIEGYTNGYWIPVITEFTSTCVDSYSTWYKGAAQEFSYDMGAIYNDYQDVFSLYVYTFVRMGDEPVKPTVYTPDFWNEPEEPTYINPLNLLEKQEENLSSEPAITEPTIEEPIMENPIIEEPVTVEPTAEEPTSPSAIEEPLIEEPTSPSAIIEPVIQEPEPTKEEPISEPAIEENPTIEPIIEQESTPSNIEEPVIPTETETEVLEEKELVSTEQEVIINEPSVVEEIDDLIKKPTVQEQKPTSNGIIHLENEDIETPVDIKEEIILEQEDTDENEEEKIINNETPLISYVPINTSVETTNSQPKEEKTEEVVIEENESEEVIEEAQEQVPLIRYNDIKPTIMISKHWALINLILLIFTVLGLLKLDEKRKYNIFNIIFVITAILIFVFTEHTIYHMVLIDKWTIVMVIDYILMLLSRIFASKKDDEEEEVENTVPDKK